MLAWVCLEGGLWWPGIILEPKSEVFVQQQQQQQQLKIVKCFGSEAELPVDLSKEDEVQILKNEDGLGENEFYDLHRGQAVKEELKQMFSNAMEELCKHLHLEKSASALSIENQNTKTSKRLDAISWDDYFMAVAFLSAMRSKDPSTQVGACIVDPRKRIVGIGYNGFPTGCSDDVLPWSRRAEDELDTKYPYVVHAEVNAILNKISAELVNCTIYVGLFPYNECAKTIIQSGIAEVVFLCDKYAHTNSMKASRRMLNMAGVRLRQHNPKATSLLVNFDSINK